MMDSYHNPVLFSESLDALKIKSNHIIVDATYGGGGHSGEILNRLGSEGVLMAFDQDDDALKNVVEDDRLLFANANFRFLLNFLKYYEVGQIDGLLADLGVSSHQFDEGKRGFSIREEGGLDMRMNADGRLTAKDVVNGYDERNLYRIFNAYADLKNTKKVVHTLLRERRKKSLTTTKELVDLISALAPPKKLNQFLAQVFQAIRIEVNDEMAALKELLEQSEKALKKGGRLVVISYHSIEDRLVKNFIRSGNFEGDLVKDTFGNVIKPFAAVNKKPMVPSDEEIERNPRSRSAKMRIAERS